MATADLGQQLAFQKAINDILNERSKVIDEQLKTLSKQNELLESMKDGLGKGIKQAAGSVGTLSTATNAAADAADKAKAAQQGFNAALIAGKKNADDMNDALEVAGKVGAAFGDALTSATTGTFGLIKAAGNLIGSLVNVGMSIASIPFKLWDAFVEKSMNMPYNPEFMQALEEIRRMFGDLASGSGKQVIGMYKQLRSSQDEAAAAGLRLQRVFGYGIEGRAAMLKFMGEMAQGLGPQMRDIVNQLGDNIFEVTYAIKGMGISAEEAGSAMKFFYHSGQNAGEMLKEMGFTAATMAKQTGFNIKTLSKAMVETIAVFPQFAKGGVQAMAKVAHYTHNLGIEVKDLQAVFDKFDSFDQAAEAASQLSQAFGVNIDAMRMVKEQDPTKRLEQLRNAFKAAGKDINSMTSAERKLAEATTGLSGAAFEAAMGEGNKKKALSESEKAAKAATQAARDQAAAMKQLAKSIERIIPPPREKYAGFFDAFSKGFSDGMFRSKNLREMMINLQMTFRQTYWFGWKFARLLFDNFPGMTELAKGFTKIFNPGVFSKFFNETMGLFETFFAMLEKDPKRAFNSLIGSLKSTLEKYFGGEGTDSALGMIKTGFMKIMRLLGTIGGEITGILIKSVTEGIRNLIDVIANPNKVTDVAGAAGSFMGEIFNPMLSAIKENGHALVNALKDLWSTVWPKIQPYVEEAGWMLAKFFAIKFAATFALTLAAEFAKQKFLQMLTGQGGFGGIAGKLTSAFDSKVLGGIDKMLGSNNPRIQKIGESFFNMFDKAGGSGGIASRLAKSAGFIGLGITIAKGLYDGVQAGMNSNKEDAAAFVDGVQTFGASILSTATLGMVSTDQIKSAGEVLGDVFLKHNPISLFANAVTGGWLHKQMNDATKKYEEMNAQIANSVMISNEGMKNALEEGKSNLNTLYETALKQGNFDDAISFAAQQAAAQTGLSFDDPKFKAERDRQKIILHDKVKKDLEDAAKKNAETAANAIKGETDKKELEKAAKIAQARTLVEQIKDVGELNSQLGSALAGLDAALAKGGFQEKINRFKTKIDEIYPLIEAVAQKIAAAREKAAINMPGKEDPLAVLGESLKGASSLANGLNKLNELPAGVDVKLAGLVTGLSNSLGTVDLTKLSAVGLDIEAFAEKISNADGHIREALKPGEGLVKVVKDIGKLGKLNVTHNIPGVQMNVSVTLDSKELAKSIINVDVSKDPQQQKRPMVGERGIDKTIGPA